jgi:hypothetical protein
MAEIDVKTEVDGDRGWTYEVEVRDGSVTHRYEVTLSWSDYDLWSRGQVAPERVVKAAFVFLLEREPADAIMKRFDCSVIRRYFPEVDKRLGQLF